MQQGNPKGRPRNNSPLLNEKHVRFIAACKANAYSAPECRRMLEAEYGVAVTDGNIKHYYGLILERSGAVEELLKSGSDFSVEAIKVAVLTVKPKAKQREIALFEEFFKEKRKIAEDPTYGVAYADRRRRAQKLSQNIDELDTPKTFAKGSYPTARNADGSMVFETYELANKDHGEQRKHIEGIGHLVDGQVSGDVIINIVDNASGEESKSATEREADKKMRELKEKKGANKSVTSEVTEDAR